MAVSGLSILYTTVHFPFPAIGGDRIKQLKILEYLALSNKIYLVSLDRGYPVADEHIKEVEKMGIVPYVFKINKLKAYLNAAALAPFGKPMEVNFFRHPAFRDKIRDIINSNRIDLTISYYLRTTQYTSRINGRKLLISDDCRTFYQSRTASESEHFRQRAIRKFETARLRKFESKISDYYDTTTYVTSQDLEQARALNGKARLRILSNGVDTGKFAPPGDGCHRRGLVFTGKLDAWVNNLIVKRIVEKILPGIRAVLPDIKLHIVGANPTGEIMSYGSDNIIIHPNVPDLAPYLQDAAVYIHPHLGGSGIQNKLLEAMACGCPVVTTHSGAWGFSIVNGFNGFVASNDKEFIDLTLNLLNNPEHAKNIGSNARGYIIENHSWQRIYEQLDSILEEIFNGRGINSGSNNINI